jgi:hypothetical protein
MVSTTQAMSLNAIRTTGTIRFLAVLGQLWRTPTTMVGFVGRKWAQLIAPQI